MQSPQRRTPVDGDTKPCPQCRQTLVFNGRYPILTAERELRGVGRTNAA